MSTRTTTSKSKKLARKTAPAARSSKKSGKKSSATRPKASKASPSTTPAHFTTRTFEFLAELSDNNDKDWFAANKARYERDVREPALAIVRAMAAPLKKISPHFTADDAKVGGSLMRVYRDVRFSADKTPYKTNIGMQFRHERGKDVHAPGFYLHVALDGCFISVGIWKPDAPALAAIRERIAEDSKRWTACRAGKAFRRDYKLSGDSLKRMPRGYDGEHPMADDLRRKDHIAVQEIGSDFAMDPALVRKLATCFGHAGGYMKFLAGALELPY